MRPGLDHTLAASAVLGLALSLAVWRDGDGGGGGGRGAGNASAAEGAALFRSKGCGSCHDAPGWTSPIGAGPSLRDAGAWAGERRDGMGARRYLAESIDDPGAFTSPAWTAAQGPLDAMPALGLDAAEVEAVVEFLVRG